MKQQGRMKAEEFFVPVLSRGMGAPSNSFFVERSPGGTFVFRKVQAGTYTLNLERTSNGNDVATINISNPVTIVVGDKDIIDPEIPIK
jgi:hypothetical protein